MSSNRARRQPSSSVRIVSDGRAASSSSNAIVDDSTYTSFSDLGAAMPPTTSDGYGSSDFSSSFGLSPSSKLSSTWRNVKNVLHPTYCLEEDAAVPSTSAITTTTTTTERTPLMETERRRRQKRKQTLSKRYAGGPAVFATANVGEIGTSGTSDDEQQGETPLAVCRQCEAAQSPVSPTKLAVSAQLAFAVMSILAEVKARWKGPHEKRTNEMALVAIQSGFLWLASTSILYFTGTKHALLGPPGLRGWVWCRAACAALSTIMFAVAAQTIPIMNLVVIVYLAPLVFNIFSILFLSTPFPFRGQLVSISLLLGLVLVIQPTVVFPGNAAYPTVPASPLDLPPIGDYGIDVPLPWAYAAACTSSLSIVFSLGLLSRAVKISVYHSIASNSLLTAIASLIIYFSMPNTTLWTGTASVRDISLLIGILVVSLFAHILQALPFQQKSPRLLSLVTFLQPVFSTALQTLFLDRSLDVLPLAGAVLIAANVAWITSPLTDEEEDEEEW